jgi:hypothetical protein
MAATKAAATKAAPAKAAPAKKATAKKATATAKPPRQRKAPAAQRVQVDERLTTMSPEALLCRSFGHAPMLLPVPGPDAVKYRRLGQKLVLVGCRNQCGRTRTIVLDQYRHVVSDRTMYEDAKSYLVQKRGAGRVLRHESRNAFFALIAGD